MADQKLTQLDALGSPANEDLMYVVDDPSGTPASKKYTLTTLKTFLKGLFHSYTTIADLGTNGTTADADNARELEINAGAYTASTTLTISNVTNLQRFSIQITNTNANVLTFSGITLYFKSDDLPDTVTFASNALTFPADTAIKYNIVGLAFDGTTFDCKIEIR